MPIAAPLPVDESARLARLRALRVLDTQGESLFDALTEAAAAIAGTPIALVSLIDEDRQWFKSNVGLPGATQTPRNVAFCAHTILDADVMEIRDATLDPRFASNPLVAGEPGVRFYAGAPITLNDGIRVGSLCVIDREPRELTHVQRLTLVKLARAAAEALDQRVLALERGDAIQRQQAAEQRLVDDHARLLNIVEATRAGTWEWNVLTGALVCNARWAELIGRSLDELGLISLQTWRAHTHGDDWQRAWEALRQHAAGVTDYLDVELRMRHRDGEWIWVRCRGRATARDERGRPVQMCGTLVDISLRKLAERRLQASEAFLDRTGRLAGVGGWEVDLETNAISWSDETCRIHDMPLGYRPGLEEAVAFYPDGAREVIQAAVAQGIESGRDWDLELPFVTAAGKAIWVRAQGTVEFEQGRPRWLVGALQDITLRKRAVHALENSERRFRKLFEFSPGMICTHDMDGTLLSVNPAAARALGYAVSELMGRPFSILLPPQLVPAFHAYLERIRRTGADHGLMHLLTKDGRQVIWQYQNVVDRDDEEPYVLAHAQDVTERDEYERKLRDLSIRDPLTGCFNRRYLAELERARHGDESWGCIAIDLDHFKQVNDTYGHPRGDEVLVGMGAFLNGHVRPDDVVIRSGGDEFIVLLKKADAATTREVCARLAADAPAAPIGFSVGLAVCDGGDDLTAALGRADQELYVSRSTRRGATRS